MGQIDATVTLVEAIRQNRLRNGEADMTEAMSTHSAQAFDMHDAVHVLFDCDESLSGEIRAHVWMALATTAPLSEMHRAVASRQHRSVLSGVGHLRLLATWLAMLPTLASIVWRSRRMMRRVPYDLSALMTLPVSAIREQFGIRTA